ncbi:hypothetical protein DV096_12580 [Bradymonadaceae bacterium TMQ3]|uniref:EexN family lipoprotein n=1 Tax=Lujinxingia sediminis TaxID=2480984 RepID=A0ABY0CQF8_9DELT|nr:hypothetical protein [Lujinxingia sediminis]RDV37936.1 hypothetical protein DV096_12580 [Bradymonadaceae bacterium TMQ3]RVU42736.1 hypothetical protein EA187_14575 [Lujinxingia sediminis]TXC75286.1 hypothetical protein FRC91_11205 [Bradymonadales bacterium TMQ1]
MRPAYTPPLAILVTLTAALLAGCFVNGGQPYTTSDQARPPAEIAREACARGDLATFEAMAARSGDPALQCPQNSHAEAEPEVSSP